jgi:hypothetical protein
MFQYVYDNGTLNIKFNKIIEENKETYESTSGIYLNELDNAQCVHILEIKFSDLVCFNTYSSLYTHKDISNINPIFNNNIECFFDLFEEKPSGLEVDDDILNITYVLQIGKRKHDITIPVNLKIIEGDAGKYEKLKLQNVFLSKKVFNLEKEYKKIMVCEILLTRDENSLMRNFEPFKTLVSTNFDVNGDFRLYSRNAIETILDYIIKTHYLKIFDHYENENGIFNTYVKFLVEETNLDINHQIKPNLCLFPTGCCTNIKYHIPIEHMLKYFIKNGANNARVSATVECIVSTVDRHIIHIDKYIQHPAQKKNVAWHNKNMQLNAEFKKVIENCLK